jgi:hypothetical protein
MEFLELSFSEIVVYEIGGGFMFYLYIDELLCLETRKFSEVRDFIFDYYYDIVKGLGMSNMEVFTEIMDQRTNDLVTGLINHRYQYFYYLKHMTEVYYGIDKHA